MGQGESWKEIRGENKAFSCGNTVQVGCVGSDNSKSNILSATCSGSRKCQNKKWSFKFLLPLLPLLLHQHPFFPLSSPLTSGWAHWRVVIAPCPVPLCEERQIESDAGVSSAAPAPPEWWRGEPSAASPSPASLFRLLHTHTATGGEKHCS